MQSQSEIYPPVFFRPVRSCCPYRDGQRSESATAEQTEHRIGPFAGPSWDHMRQSHVIEVSGQFAGAAVSHCGAFRFIAVDPRVEELDESVWPSLPDVQRVVGHLLTTGRLLAKPDPEAR